VASSGHDNTPHLYSHPPTLSQEPHLHPPIAPEWQTAKSHFPTPPFDSLPPPSTREAQHIPHYGSGWRDASNHQYPQTVGDSGVGSGIDSIERNQNYVYEPYAPGGGGSSDYQHISHQHPHPQR
jgi:hypothetical protein